MTRATSFRDPGGYVYVTKDRVIRTVLPEGLGNLNACLKSSVARRFVDEGALIATHPLDEDEGPGKTTARNEILVEHPRIPFVSYPHEWPPVMLHAAAQLTLDLCTGLLDEGRGLKDATPANILFEGPRPVFVDVLSFEEREPLDPIWMADAQFTRTFLIPLLLYRRTGFPTHEIFLLHRDGIAPEDAVRRLPGLRRWFPPDLGLITLPASASRLENDRLYRPRKAREADEARFILARHFRGLGKKLESLAPLPVPSKWSNYEAQCPSYSGEQQAAKRHFVERTLGEIASSQSENWRVLDVGSNTGEFSFIAAAGASVVSIDSDPETVGALWRSARARNAAILPLVVDLARPSPAAGWCGTEYAAFLERAEGFFDCVLFLAVIHHLMVTDQIPLDQIFDAAASLTKRWLVVEYIGPADPMFHRLARGRDALYEGYNRTVFEESARRAFDMVSALGIPSSDRAVYVLRRKT